MADSEEELRRQREISSFAAMALGANPVGTDGTHDSSWGSLPPSTAEKTEDGIEAGGTGTYKRSSSSSSLTNIPGTHNDGAVTGNVSIPPLQPSPLNSWTEDMIETPKRKQGAAQGDRQFLNASGTFVPGDSGTFHLAPPNLDTPGDEAKVNTSLSENSLQKSRDNMQQSNLEAAAAALSGMGNISTPTAPHRGSGKGKDHASHFAFPPHLDQHPGSGPPPRWNAFEETPMFAEKVLLPRPLFFGPWIPPRVLREARAMVKAAWVDLKASDPQSPPRLGQFPPAVRNVVGALRVYGYGIDLLLEQEEEERQQFSLPDSAASSSEAGFTGDEMSSTSSVSGSIPLNSYVTTYQPVWGHEERLERIKDYRKRRRPLTVTRSSTAPARLGSWTFQMPEDDFSVTSAAGQLVGHNDEDDLHPPPPPPPPPQSYNKVSLDNEQFSSWLRGDDDSASMGRASSGSLSMSSVRSLESLSSPQKGPRPEDDDMNGSAPMTEQEMFSQWARGHDAGTLRGTVTVTIESSSGEGPFNPSTFHKLPRAPAMDSDEDSVIDDELKKQVGINDHLSKAIASLAVDEQPTAYATIDEAPVLLSQVPKDGSRARPLTNYELTNGCVPIFGVDDAPLPSEGDLGVHETKDEQLRSTELKRSQEIIDKYVAPNVFSSIACPNPALNPDDFHSWNSRMVAGSQRLLAPGGTISSDASLVSYFRRSTSGGGSIGQLPPPSGKPPRKDSMSTSKKKISSRARYGWWNVADEESGDKKEATVVQMVGFDQIMHLPPTHHSATTLQPIVLLNPLPDKLREDNLPLSRMHAATSMAQALPYLADRPPSYRFLQIDTQAVGFPPMKGEVEPLFCSVAIYHVETVSSEPGSEQTVAPVPDLQRCARVTEALHFDVVSDALVAKRCSGSLWPYAKSILVKKWGSDERLQGTRCGVFPLPSNLNVSNLYAVLVVRKVFADESDFEPYIKPGKNIIDVEKLRANAEKAANRHGHFLLPFAFGVAPLLQVFGTDNPTVASSRAVQIPLFRFTGEEKQIVEHIMVMLYPKADHKANGIGGPAPVTNGGTALLVMRNFGYLGLHAAVDNKSTLARDRLVDFTGELQFRRKTEQEQNVPQKRKDSAPTCAFTSKHAEFHPHFLAEPTQNGGRNVADVSHQRGVSSSEVYAQELAPLPLQLTPSVRLSSVMQPGPRNRLQTYDVEPFYHTAFCNELLCHPRLLHNCSKGNMVVKVEFRELEWNEDFNRYVAFMPRFGPSIHNNRRGPFLVPYSFTSCSHPKSDHYFMEEFKMKLPLDLRPHSEGTGRSRTLSLFFTVYRLKLSSKSKWTRAKNFFGNSSSPVQTDIEEIDPSGKSRLSQVACGFLPLTNQGSLIDNGMHDVRVVYKARGVPAEMKDKGVLDPSALVLLEANDLDESIIQSGRDDSCASSVSNDSVVSDEYGVPSAISRESASETASVHDENRSRSGRGKEMDEPISLSVRIVVHSSLHPQNESLCKFLDVDPGLPLVANLPTKAFLSTLRLGRESLLLSTGPKFRRSTSAAEEKLLDSILAVSNHQLCSTPRTATHLLRLMPALWRTVVFGNGDPDLMWANPAATISLRVHSFATILHILGAASLYFQKSGLTQLDGSTPWNVAILGRILALLFDERTLFGKHAVEKFDDVLWAALENPSLSTGSPSTRKTSPKKRRHIRQSYEIFNEISREKSSGPEFSSQAAEGGSGTVRRSQDNINLGNMSQPHKKETSDAQPSLGIAVSRLESLRTSDVKIDSISDFQTALRAGSDDDEVVRSSGGAGAARAMIQAFGGFPGGNRRWLTAPSKALSTIQESDGDESALNVGDLEESVASTVTPSDSAPSLVESLGDEAIFQKQKGPSKQFRVPRIKKSGSAENVTIAEDSSESSNTASQDTSVPKNDEEIESAGTAFLDAIGKSLGISAPQSSGEDRRVGSSHHRKTRSRSSIDWSLLGDERPTLPSVVETEVDQETSADFDERMSTLRKEEASAVRLPGFVDRLITLGRTSAEMARWFPYTYEVIIMQWSAVLFEQRRQAEKNGSDLPDLGNVRNLFNSVVDENLAQAALRSVGVAVASAPLLFEVIKASMGFRLRCLFDEILSNSEGRDAPPLVILDETMLSQLEQIISMVADACIDSRNFDSWDLRQMSIDVNDSIVRFLRDMFSFLSPSCVQRLILSYLARFLVKDGKQWQDRDSKIGLRCSWEIAKLRLNAVTALVRFPDFIRVNSPQALSWTSWWSSTEVRVSRFFDMIIDRYQTLRLPNFVGRDGTMIKPSFDLPRSLKPHWLAEITVDICLQGTEHAEPKIQHRAASLLHELFWSCSQESVLLGISAPVASMFISFIEKLLACVGYLSNFSPKFQLRKDILPCAIFVLHASPPGLLRSLWRRLFAGLVGKGTGERYGGLRFADVGFDSAGEKDDFTQMTDEPIRDDNDILGVFSLLNLILRTVEYEGCEEHQEPDITDSRDIISTWRRESLLSPSPGLDQRARRKPDNPQENFEEGNFTSSISRRWQAHDASIVVVNAAHQIVWEMYTMLRASPRGRALLNPAVNSNGASRVEEPVECNEPSTSSLGWADIVIFVRAATSVYLHALSLKESDLVVVRTFKISAEVIKIFGIKMFLEAVGETLQHWMRVISLHSGARRSQIRIEATDFLELILRSTWECYGSFFRIRVPLLAVQTEVMERIVATAATRYYRDQRKMGTTFETFSNLCAEASLVPLWRSLDRIERQPASRNVAFRGALIRMAGKLKKLYRAYVAARVLSFIQGSRTDRRSEEGEARDFETEALIRAKRISILRVINQTEAHSKQFLGFQGTSQDDSRLAHSEAVEDALLDAADVFTPTELPEHRVAWLRMLADYHNSRKKFAEEATCHFQIHVTLHQAARLHGSLWSNTPFLPWTDNMPDPVYIDGDTPPADPDYQSDLDLDDTENHYGRQMENANSFRRIFYRVANSVGMANEDWEGGASKTLFCGITFPFEYKSVSPWITLREMEENMVEEAEEAGALFLSAGIIESSRYAWGLATQYYAEKFNYAKLALVYGNLARAVVSQVPPIDSSLPQEVSATLGRFYRVWFHGGAPDELSGVEFVYRTEGSVRLEQFGENLKEVIKSIIPDKTPIHLLLDGRQEERLDDNAATFGFSRIGPLEPVRIKVTPLRPLFGKSVQIRGLPEWFQEYVNEAFSSPSHRHKSDIIRRTGARRFHSNESADSLDPHHREHGRSYSATMFSSGGSSTVGNHTTGRMGNRATVGDGDRVVRFAAPGESDLARVDKFCFLQPRDRARGTKDWWRSCAGDFAEKSLKVTQLQVRESFPACVARQAVVHRLVYSQSPLEAGTDAVCQWCAVLFRTAVATSGMALLGTNADPGIGTESAKVVADCIHSSQVKEIGMALLKKDSDLVEGDSSIDLPDYDRISEDEIQKLQLKLARLIVVFIELLHLLIARNRDILLGVIQERKKGEGSSIGGATGRQIPRSSSVGSPAMVAPSVHSLPLQSRDSHHRAASSVDYNARPPRRSHGSDAKSDEAKNNIRNTRASSDDQQSQPSTVSAAAGVRTDSAIAVQSELQRAFINLTKSLYPRIQRILQGETPRWLKSCAQDNYFSLGTYKQTKIPIAEELCFTASDSFQNEAVVHGTHAFPTHAAYDPGYESPRGSVGGGSVGSSRNSEKYGFGQF